MKGSQQKPVRIAQLSEWTHSVAFDTWTLYKLNIKKKLSEVYAKFSVVKSKPTMSINPEGQWYAFGKLTLENIIIQQ